MLGAGTSVMGTSVMGISVKGTSVMGTSVMGTFSVDVEHPGESWHVLPCKKASYYDLIQNMYEFSSSGKDTKICAIFLMVWTLTM